MGPIVTRRRPAVWLIPALALLLAGWLLVFLAEASPHLVHHLFDDEEHAECGYQATVDHGPADSPVPVVALPVLPVCGRVGPPSAPLAGSAPPPARATRGPPTRPLVPGPDDVRSTD
jgi:hypothetical protein